MVQTVVTSGDLCVFRRVDNDQKLLIGRIVQFSYLTGTKRQQEYSRMYVHFKKDQSGIGTFANWFHFSPLMDVFTQGMEKESFDYSNWIQITSQYDNYRF